MDELNANELNEAARSLIARAMEEDAPPSGAEDQSWGMVVSKIESTTGAPQSATPEPGASIVAPPPASSRWIGAAVLALALVAVVGLGVWVVQSGPPPQPGTPAPAKAPHHAGEAPASHHAGEAPASHHAGKGEPAGAEGVPSRGPAPVGEPAPAKPDAAAIARMLDDAEAALDANDAAGALVLLEQHAEAAPADPQMQRRLALRVLTLCKLERTDDARSEATAFLARHGSSRWAADVRASCAARRR